MTLTGLDYAKATSLASYDWSYDQANRLTSELYDTAVSAARSVTYGYDATGQVTSAAYDDSQSDEGYTYDDTGNRTNTGYATDTGNRLTSDGMYTYEYDAEGNRTMRYVWTDADSDGVVDTGERNAITEYAWDYRNRLVSVTDRATEGGPATQIVTYTYDAFNHLVGRDLDTNGDGQVDQRRRLVYDGDKILAQFDGTGSSLSAADLSHAYLWSAAVDQLVADDNLSTDQTLWALGDQLGTARDLATYDAGTDTTSIADHRVYDSFGNLESETSALDYLFGYTGQIVDDATDLQNHHNRWYDPAAGRWLSEDPIGINGGDANLYRYVGNTASTVTDPSGLAEISISAAPAKSWWQRANDWLYDLWSRDFVDERGQGTNVTDSAVTDTARRLLHQNLKPIGAGVVDTGAFVFVSVPSFA